MTARRYSDKNRQDDSARLTTESRYVRPEERTLSKRQRRSMVSCAGNRDQALLHKTRSESVVGRPADGYRNRRIPTNRREQSRASGTHASHRVVGRSQPRRLKPSAVLSVDLRAQSGGAAIARIERTILNIRNAGKTLPGIPDDPNELPMPG